MPLLKPNVNESQDDFISRCMGNPTMNSEFPDSEQRAAVCHTQWSEKMKKDKKDKNYKNDKTTMKNITSIHEGHLHEYEIDVAGNGKTFFGINPDMKDDHIHQIDLFVVQPGGEDEHIHEMLAANNKEGFKLETVKAKGVEIFQTGYWKGDNYTESDLDEVIKNFREGVIEPFINIDHSDKATGQFKDALKSLSLGFVENLYKKGDKLIADFKQIPKKLADLMEGGALKKKSVELYSKYMGPNGKLYKNVLEAVTFFGNGVPAVNTLDDFMKLYKGELRNTPEVIEGNELITLKNEDFEDRKKTKNNSMGGDTMEITKDEFNELNKFKNDAPVKNETIKSQTEEIEKFKADKVTSDEKITKLEGENKDLNKFKTEAEEEGKKNLDTEASEYIDGQIKEGKITPASKDMYIKNYKAAKDDEDEKVFKLFKSDIETRNKMLFEGAIKDGEGEGTSNVKDVDDLDIAIKAKMKGDKKMTFKEAREQILAEMDAEV